MIIAIRTTCSIIWLIDGSLIYVCPWRYPLLILSIGIISRANEIALITNDTSSTVLPPSKSPIIKLANIGAKIKHIKNDATEKILITFVAISYILTFLSSCFRVWYSLVNLLMASGIPADDIIRNILYML